LAGLRRLNRSEILFDSIDAAAAANQPPPRPPKGWARCCLLSIGPGVVLGVISNDQTHGIKHFLAAHGLEKTSGASGAPITCRPNPIPWPSITSAPNWALTLGACALIGDADSDLAMAVAAGIPHALGYTAGWATKPKLAGGHLLIDHWSELTVQATDPANHA